ncbi:FAD-containing monooxygenase EthA [Paramyrothecium foliicola]|nr:FAD-containing monooxygenase EthA [Paramyrothecium foliicola]
MAQSDGVREEHDIIIMGGGLVGINTAHNLQKHLPHRKFIILEARDTSGGTWDLFRYPGIRSDLPMTTLGFTWYPWPHAHKIGSGPEIAQYLEDAARAGGITNSIRYRHKVMGLEWRSSEQRWTLDVHANNVAQKFCANIIINCMGYYSYEKGFDAAIPGIDSFGGQVVHPQFWPENLDHSGKRIIVIGSGATSVTLIPNLVKEAGHLTMLQRSPSYMLDTPTHSSIDNRVRALLPLSWASWVLWWKDLIYAELFRAVVEAFPNFGRSLVRKHVSEMIPKHVDVDVHFNPRHNLFQQRICFAPNGDFFEALHRDNCEIVTDTIEMVKEDGVLLKSGRFLPADMIITATGLHIKVLGGLIPVVDGEPFVPGSHYVWRGCMLDSLPNVMLMQGHTRVVYTAAVDVMARQAVRVMKHMEKKGATSVVPKIKLAAGVEPKPFNHNVSSTYFIEAEERIPKVTGEGPWYARDSLVKDWCSVWFGDVEEGLVYAGAEAKKTA